MYNAKSLMDAVPIVAAVFARSCGIEIRYHDGSWKTDGKTVWLPHLPFDASQDLCMLLLRELAHEVQGHVVNSDFKAVAEMAKKSTLHQSLLNAIEDPRIERCAFTARRGVRAWLDKGRDVLLDKGIIRTGTTENPADTLITYILLNGGLANGMEGRANSLVPACRANLVSKIGDSGVRRLDGLLASAWPSMKSTADAAEVVEDVIELLKDIEEEQKEQQQSGQQGQQGGNAPQNQQGQDQQGSNAQQDPQGAGQGSDPQDQPGASDGASQILSSDPTLMHIDQQAHQAIEQMARVECGSSSTRSPGGSSGPKLTTASFEIATLDGAPTAGHRNPQRYSKLKARISGSVNRLMMRLEQKVTELRMESERLGTKGRLATNRLHRLSQGDLKIFRKETVQEWRELALTVVEDLSGSMRGSSEEAASTGLIALAEVCERLNIPLEVVSFGQPIVQFVKRFDEPLRGTVARFGALDKSVGGCTPMGEGVLAAAVSLLQRPEPRKVLCILTDGAADNPDAMRQVVARLKGDVELIGLSIGCDLLSGLLPTTVTAEAVEDVGPALCQLVARHMADVH